MKTLLSISLIVSMFFCSSLLSQDLKGIATYKTQRKMEVALDSTRMDDAMRSQVMAMLKKQFEKEFELEFTAAESMYKEVEKLDTPGTGASFVQMQVVSSGDAGDILYKNLDENRFTSQNEVFSKQFLIQDPIEKQEWKLEKETKNIGEYTCFKATYTRMANVVNSVRSSGDDSEAAEEREEEIIVTAWYTPQIPIGNGPSRYGGLPGLILEISDGQETILCNKIILNPKKGVAIKEPREGKKVNQDEFDIIMEKKMKEMNERYENNNGGEDGERIEIRIGG
jgi:GLPGLI family protein